MQPYSPYTMDHAGVDTTLALPGVEGALCGEIVSMAPDAIVAIDSRYRILLFNRGAEEMFGYAATEVEGRSVDMLLPEAVRDRHLREHLPAFASGSVARRRMGDRGEVEGRRKSGELFPAEIAIARTTLGGQMYFSAILRDVSGQRARDRDLARQQEALATANAELLRSNAELEEYASVASHDLQEPLRAIVTHTRLLSERCSGHLDPRAAKHMQFVVDGASRMQALIEDLLVVSRIGTHGHPFRSVDLDALLGDALRSLEAALRESRGEVVADVLPTVRGDPAQLGQLFLNLLANALKFHRPGRAPHVAISAQPDVDGWKISVTDNGIGIAPEYRDRVFQLFKRLHSRDEYPGTGIGLSICRRVVERHGGRIWIEGGPDGGTTFCFTLPRHDATIDAPADGDT